MRSVDSLLDSPGVPLNDVVVYGLGEPCIVALAVLLLEEGKDIELIDRHYAGTGGINRYGHTRKNIWIG